NNLYQILSPNEDDQGVWIQQNAWFYLGKYDTGATDNYTVHLDGNGVYIFVIKGEVEIENQKLNSRDGLGIWDVNSLNITANSETEILLMEIPMQ
ncbi:MAG: pirin family protein, partial [Maribacter dokdonensis]